MRGPDARALYARLAKETVPCPLCESPHIDPLHADDRFGMGLTTVLCRRCGFLYTNPRPTAAAMKDFYREHYRLLYTDSHEPAEDHLRNSPVRRRAESLLNSVKTHLAGRPRSRVLDVGCGAGVFLSLVRENFSGCVLFGVEPDARHAAFAREKSGAAVTEQSVEEWLGSGPAGGFDLILLNHVLEHLHRPAQTLGALARLLNPDGSLLIEVPDALSDRWPDPLDMFHLAHLGHFTERTLLRTLREAGMERSGSVIRRSDAEPWAIAFVCRKAKPIAGKNGPDRVFTAERTAADWTSFLRKAEARRRTLERLKKLPLGAAAAKAVAYHRHYGTLGTLRKTVRYASDALERRVGPAAHVAFGPWIAHARARARQNSAPLLRRAIEGRRVLVLGSGPSAAQIERIPEGTLLFTCNQGVRLVRDLGSPRIDLYLCTKSKIRRFPVVTELFRGLRAGIAALDDPSFARRDPVLKNAFQVVIEDDGTDPAYLEALIAPSSARAIRGSSHHAWTSTGIRLLQYALYFGAREVHLAGIDLGDKGYAWGSNLEPWFHDDIDENFLKIVRERHPNVYSACAKSPVSRILPYRPLDTGVRVEAELR